MFQKEKPMSLKSSTSAICNNLSIHVSPEKKMINYAVVHKSVVNLVSACMDGSTVNHRQVVCKESAMASMVLQARLLDMVGRAVLVIASQRGIQMYEAEGSIMLYFHPIAESNSNEPQPTFGRGICAVRGQEVCVGNHEGQIYVFSVPARGNITLKETVRAHNAAVCDIRSHQDFVASSDDMGNIVLWDASGRLKEVTRINGMGYPCSSLGLMADCIVASYGSGHLRVYSTRTGKQHAEATAHGKWITAIDVAPKNGMVASVGEDCFLRVWQIRPGEKLEFEHLWSERVGDIQLQGVQFITPDGRALAVTGYDNNEIIFYKR